MDKSRYKEQTEILRYFMKPYIHRNLFTALRIYYIIINLQLNNKRFDCQKVVKKIDGDFDSILRIITISKLQRTKKKTVGSNNSKVHWLQEQNCSNCNLMNSPCTNSKINMGPVCSPIQTLLVLPFKLQKRITPNSHINKQHRNKTAFM